MKSRLLAILAGLVLCASASAGSLIPSTASGVYTGNGWECAATAALVSTPVGAEPSVSFACRSPAGVRLIGYGQRQQYSYECPRATEQGDATAASLWPESPPWTVPVGLVVVRSYDPGSPAVIVADIAGPGQAPARIALGRTQAITVPAPNAYGCTASGKVVTGSKRDR